MPQYSYSCTNCSKNFDRILKDPNNAKCCPYCGCSKINRTIGSSTFVLKGGGWANDSYSRSSKE